MLRALAARPLALALARAALVAAALAALAGCEPADGGGAPTADQPAAPSAAARPAAMAPGQVPGVFDDRIVFGQSAAFSGPAQELGRNMQLGILAAFQEANANGGVHGRMLELESLDDAYEPEAAATNTLQLINDHQVFALIGAVGTPTSRSATPVALEAGVPYLAPFTGAEFLRSAENLPNVVNMRASYYQETEQMVERLYTDLGARRIAVLYQDDSYGRAGYRGVQLALERRGGEPVAVAVYPRNTTAVKTALLDLREGDPDAVIMIGAYQPVASVIAWARQISFSTLFMTVSFVGSNALAQELGPAGTGVVVTQVVPFPTDDDLPVVAAYHRALAAHDPEAVPGFVSLEGYLAGRLAITGLERCGRELTRACLLDSYRSGGAVDIDGFSLSYGQGDNQGSDQVFITMIGPNARYFSMGTLGDARI